MKYKTYLGVFVGLMVALVLFQNLFLFRHLNGDEPNKTTTDTHVRIRYNKPKPSVGSTSKQADIVKEEPETPKEQTIATVKPQTPSPTPAPVAEAPKPVEAVPDIKQTSNLTATPLQENKTAPLQENKTSETDLDSVVVIPPPTPKDEKNDTLAGADSSNGTKSMDRNTVPLNVTRLTLTDVEDWEQSSSVGLVVATSPEVEAHLIHNSQQPVTSPIAWPNVTTLSYTLGGFRSGYRNQIMAFTMMVFRAIRHEHGQLLMDSFKMKDNYGTNRFIPFRDLWDVPHWNSHYPKLPRLVDYDPIIHDQFNPNTSPPRYQLEDKNYTNVNGTFISPYSVRPYVFGDQKLMFGYKGYAKGRGYFAVDGHRNPTEILMMQGAMRPHPDMQAIIDQNLKQLVKDSTPNPDGSFDYMTLHARVEPDMQAHPMCREKKVLNLTTIFDFVQTKWPKAPVSTIFMPINRKVIELEAVVKSNISETNWIAIENLRALNWARDEGLWNGTAKVVEFGRKALEGTRFEDKPSTPGAMLDFFIGVNAKIFIGTEVSSFSHDLLATRFFRNLTENYYYIPDGLHDWSPPGSVDPAGFRC
eukprot:Nitzschia sp. Nitz4//NODE_202_length_38933_cov_72.610268//9051//10802//NITZ4_additional_000020-RA//1//CDS//3329531780//1778//frame0